MNPNWKPHPTEDGLVLSFPGEMWKGEVIHFRYCDPPYRATDLWHNPEWFPSEDAAVERVECWYTEWRL